MIQRPPKPVCLAGFEHINRYWDPVNLQWTAKILPGELYVSRSGDEVVATTLGSCVSACIRDPEVGIGGMNHFMLPLKSDGGGFDSMDLAARYGNHAMEQLINEVIRQGGRRKHLEVKVTGGARILSGVNDVGRRNIDFVLQYVALEQLTLKARDLGDSCARKVVYSPATGRLRVKRLRSLPNGTLTVREQNYRRKLSGEPLYGSVELF